MRSRVEECRQPEYSEQQKADRHTGRRKPGSRDDRAGEQKDGAAPAGGHRPYPEQDGSGDGQPEQGSLALEKSHKPEIRRTPVRIAPCQHDDEEHKQRQRQVPHPELLVEPKLEYDDSRRDDRGPQQVIRGQ